MEIRINNDNSRDNGNIKHIMLITYRLHKKIEHVHTHTPRELQLMCGNIYKCVCEREGGRFCV